MVQIDYEELMRNKTDDELRVYIDNTAKYQPEAVKAAIAEIEARGNFLSAQEVAAVHTEIEKADKEVVSEFKLIYSQDDAVVTDTDAPLLYSKRALWGFTLFCGPLFGSILMAINLGTNKLKGVTPVVLFGILYTIAIVLVLRDKPEMIRGLTIPLGFIAGAVLNNYFWPKYIGNKTTFRKKQIWIPLGIAFFIFLFTLAMIFRGLN